MFNRVRLCTLMSLSNIIDIQHVLLFGFVQKFPNLSEKFFTWLSFITFTQLFRSLKVTHCGHSGQLGKPLKRDCNVIVVCRINKSIQLPQSSSTERVRFSADLIIRCKRIGTVLDGLYRTNSVSDYSEEFSLTLVKHLIASSWLACDIPSFKHRIALNLHLPLYFFIISISI